VKPQSLILNLSATALLLAATSAGATVPKYVFFFLGDGMANAQIQATEAYLTTINGGSAMVAADLLLPENRLNMTKMPVQGMQTTYDSYALMTDSASSATAFGSGIKTKSGVINMDPETQTACYKSIAQLAHESGKKVGVISSVSLDHATPASYYASVPSRGLMNSIGTQLAESGYEFFGGGGLVAPEGPARTGDTTNNIWNLLSTNGYTVLNDRASILGLKTHPIDKVVAINPTLDGSSAMPYAIDRPEGNLSLKEMVEVAIANLEDRPKRSGKQEKGNSRKGFFLMVEGGKIDWACHANDAVATINDMLDFDAAVAVALEFATRHPKETLVVVTGDHETGGMTIGHATTAYTAYYDRLLGQTNSFDHFANNQWAQHKAAHSESLCANDTQRNDNLASDKIMLGYMSNVFGLELRRFERLSEGKARRRLRQIHVRCQRQQCRREQSTLRRVRAHHRDHHAHPQRACQHRLDLVLPYGRARPSLRARFRRIFIGRLLRQHRYRQAPGQAHAPARHACRKGLPLNETTA
jgi:alkaline phosphatase